MRKKIIQGIGLVVIFGVAAIFSGCEDEKQQESCFDGIQNQNELGIDCGGYCIDCKLHPKMTAKINGAAWTADTAKLDVSYAEGSSILEINAKTSTTYPSMSLIYVGSLTVGTYPLNSSTSYTNDFNSSVAFMNSGTITFSEIKTYERILKGTFSFTCSTQGGTAYTISEGVFEDIKY